MPGVPHVPEAIRQVCTDMAPTLMASTGIHPAGTYPETHTRN